MLVQIKNPKTEKYTKIDTEKGIILAHKKTKGPYKNIKIVKRKGEKVMAISAKKVNRLVKEYLRVKELKDEYTLHTKKIGDELIEKYEDYINKHKYPIQIITSTSFVYDPQVVLKTMKSIPKFVKVVSIKKAELKKEVDKKTLAIIDSQSETAERKSIRFRKVKK